MASEDDFQRIVVGYLRVAAPELCVFAVPNGGYRHPAEARKMKGTGVMAGVADLCVMGPGFVGWIELKTKTGRQQPSQKTFEDTCKRLDIPYALCRSIEDVEATVRGWGLPLRSRSAD